VKETRPGWLIDNDNSQLKQHFLVYGGIFF